jgi:hypothetical protein
LEAVLMAETREPVRVAINVMRARLTLWGMLIVLLIGAGLAAAAG